MAKKEDFYDELDKKAKHSFCSCQTLALGFLVLALLIAGAIFLAVRQITTAVKPTRQVTATQNNSTELRDKLTNLAKATGASTSLTITEQELTSLLVEAIRQSPQVPLRELQAQINPKTIILNGTATAFINSNLTIDVLPKVINGQPVLELVKIQAGTLAVPALLTQKIDQWLSQILNRRLASLEGITIKSIQLERGQMTISGVISEPSASLKQPPSPKPSSSSKPSPSPNSSSTPSPNPS